MISFKCPHCQKPLGINDEHAGKKASCPGCKNVIVVPSPTAARAAAPPPVAKPNNAAPPAAKPNNAAVSPRPAPAAPPPPTKPAAATPPAKPAPPAAAPPAKSAPAAATPPKPAAAPPKPAAKPEPPAAPRPAAATMKPEARPAASTATADAIKSATPTPVPPPETEIEEAAAEALADKPVSAAEILAKQTTEFQCPWCDEKVSVNINMAGKQTPCPACKRIVKVPALVKEEPLDWRKEKKRGPSLAKQNDEELEGAWTTAKTETVDRQTLEEAGAIVEKREPMTWGQRLRYVVYAVVLAGVGFGGYRLYTSFSTHKLEDRLYERVMAYFDPEKSTVELDAATASELRRRAGEFCLRSDQPDNLATAHTHFQIARGSALAITGPDRDAALLELARTQAEVVPDPKYIERAVQKRDAQKVFDRSMQDVEKTLLAIQSPAAKADAFRLVTRTLVARQRPTFPRALASKVPPPEQAEILGVVGLELLQAGQQQEATAALDHALQTVVPPDVPVPADAPAPEPGKSEKPAVIAPSVIALCVLLNKPAAVLEKLKSQGDLAWRLGNAEAMARNNDAAKARETVKGLASPMERWRLLALVAVAGLEKESADLTDLEVVLKELEGKKLKVAKGDLETSWLLVRLARLAARADKVELADRLALAIPEPQLVGQAQFEILRARLERTKGKADEKWVDDVGNATSAYGRARCLLARHNARYGGSGSLLKSIESWDPEGDRPLGFIGVAIGLQDGEQQR